MTPSLDFEHDVDFFRQIFNSIQQAVIVTTPNGNVVLWNEYATLLYGYSKEEALGKTTIELISPNELKHEHTEDLIEYSSGNIKTTEFIVKNKSGRTFPISVNASPIYNTEKEIVALVGISHEITKQKDNEKKRMESEEKFRMIAENTSDGIFISDHNGSIKYSTPAYRKQLGFDKDIELTLSVNEIYELVHPSDRVELFATIYKAIAEKQSELRYTFRAQHKNGHYIWREDHANFRYDENGNLLESYVIARDITEKKNAEIQLMQQNIELSIAKNKAEESERLKSAFLKNISHEVRTPLNAIAGFSDLLLRPNITPEKQKLFSEIVHKSMKQMLSVIENLITLAFIETNQIKFKSIEFDPNKLVCELFDEFKRLHIDPQKSHIEFAFNINTDVNITINNDFSHIKQIFNILLNNAFKFTSSGKIEIGYILCENHINFYVSDTGIGIPADKQEVIFKSFAQADDTIRQLFGGVGLGLSIAVGLIKLIGGKLTIESEESKGTKINFCLPIVQINNIEIKKTNTNKTDLQNIKVLVVEDELFNLMYIKELLSETGMTIVHASNGKKAVQQFKNQDFDIILMDLKMPIMDGFEATAQIRKINQTIPIIAQTAFSFKREDCIKAGFNDYVSKPFKQEQLLKLIEQYVGK